MYVFINTFKISIIKGLPLLGLHVIVLSVLFDTISVCYFMMNRYCPCSLPKRVDVPILSHNITQTQFLRCFKGMTYQGECILSFYRF